jgi:anti-sigma regulatory factor (Ser/Thr protein kinase)
MTARQELVLFGAAPELALEALRWTELACRRAGLDARACQNLGTAVIEAVNNSLEHGYALAPGDVSLTLDVEPEHVVITISDHGSGLPPSPSTGIPAPGAERGRGSWIMQQACDEVRHDFTAGQQSVVLLKRRRGLGPDFQGDTP